MKKTTLKSIILSIFLMSISFGFSQEKLEFTFQGEKVEMLKNIDSFQWNQIPNTSKFNNHYYGCISFDNTPTQEIQNDFKNKGLGLTYISKGFYFFNFSSSVSTSYLKNSGVTSIIPMPANFKISSKIRNNEIEDWARDGDNILVILQFHQEVSTTKLIAELTNISGVQVVEQFKNSDLIQLSIPSDAINQVASLPFVKWVELTAPPSIKEDVRGKSIHRSSNLDTQTLSGRNYTGEGIGVIVRDDGIVGPHIDFQGRIDNTSASGTGQTHGDGVAGILTGAGNLDPTKRGMAPGAALFITNYGSSFLDPGTINRLTNGDAQITNSSYGDGCNGGYTTRSVTVDQQTNTNPSILHVFSAGNSGTSNCGYGAGSGWGNITGGHKQGKNVIATANVYFNGVLENSSSRGPAADGRIKPDITAHGQGQLSTNENNAYLSFGGTSGAAPGIAGVSAQLYQLYKDANSNQIPESALIKATLLNTANDYGNVGPDFQFGWGLVNGLRAAKLLEDGRYLDDNITQGTENNHTINVPANTKQVRFMVYWNDPAATAGVTTALVNDIDLTVSTPASAELLPWILDSTPNATNLNTPATNGADHLNNMEQVLINNPQAGNYTINISGFNIPSGPQHYFVVYEVITEELTLTYPNGNEKFVVGEQEAIHWDAINTTDSFVLEYSTNNGSTWSTMATVSASTTNYTWAVPNNISGEALIRITSGSFSDQSDAAFSIANQVAGVDISQICPEEITVVWNALTDATSYDVYLLGDKYMEKVGTTSSTSLAIPITDPNASFWVAVSATGGNNWETRRSLAINKSGGLLNCSLSKDVTVESITNDFSALNLICSGNNSFDITANIRNLGMDDQSNFLISYQLGANAIVEETYANTLVSGAQEEYTFSTPLVLNQDGNQTLKVWVTLTGDEFVANDEHEVDFYAQVIPKEINEIESFDVNGFPPPGWSMENPDGGLTWVSADNIIGIDDQPSTVSFIDNESYTSRGQEDTFTTLIYDLSGSNLSLSFDLAKAQYSATYNDRLKVDISSDCGATYTNIYDKDGLDLSTLSGYNSASSWAPTSGSDWRTETIDLSSYANQNVKIRFVSINDYSNSTYIDNIVVTGTLSTNRVDFDDNFTLFPNPVDDSFTVRSKQADIKKVVIYNLLGREVSTLKIDGIQQLVNINTISLSSGVYLVRLESDLGVFHKKIVKK